MLLYGERVFVLKKLLCLAAMIFTLAFFAGCSSENTAKYDIQKAGDEITAQIESASQMTKVNDDILTQFYGISTEDVNDYYALISTDSTKQDEVIMVEAKDSEALQRVTEKIRARYDSKYAQTKDYLPEQAKLIEECSVESEGSYVWMFVSEDAEQMDEIFRSTAQ